MLLFLVVESIIACFGRTFRAPHCLGGCIELLPFVTLWIQLRGYELGNSIENTRSKQECCKEHEYIKEDTQMANKHKKRCLASLIIGEI